MIPAPFDYVRATSVDDAIAALAGGEARLLAGGQSLLPMMKLRLAAPERLIDVGGLAELRYIRRDGDVIAIGAATRYCEILASDVVRQSVPLLARVTARIGDAQVRYRGTIGGSLAHADPAADLPAVVLALDADLVMSGSDGPRTVAASEFFVDHFTTCLVDDEMLTEVRIPVTGAEKCWYQRFSGRSTAWPIVAVAVAGTRIALAGMGTTPLRALASEDVLASGGDFAAAAELAAHGTSPVGDAQADADYRRHLARVLTLRALTAAHRR
jgi:carbon-monoxide dehydrogenase medium subunit